MMQPNVSTPSQSTPISGSMTQQQPLTPNNPAAEEFSWKFRMGTRACGTVGGFFSLLMGLFACITLEADCLAAGMIQMFIGFCVVALESPCFCPFLDFIQQVTKFSESRPPWQKALLYCSLSPIPLFLCFEFSTFFGLAIIFTTGMLYGMMALGKKADRQTMLSRMADLTTSKPKDSMDITLVDKDKQPNFFSA